MYYYWGWSIYSYYDRTLDIVLDLGYCYIVIWCCVFLVLNAKLQYCEVVL